LIAIIDLDSVAFSAASPNKIVDSEGKPIKKEGKFVYEDKTNEQISESVDFLMNQILKRTRAEGYIAYIKGKGNYRYSVNPEYKANRPKESPKWWKFTKECFINHWRAVEVNEIEVDDAVNITRLKIPDSFICAIDKDLLSLEGKHYNWRKDEWVSVDKREAEYLFARDMYTGQSGDNVKGIVGVGIVAAERILSTVMDGEVYLAIALESYIVKYGEHKGVLEFYKNYRSLKILEDYDNFEIPEICELKKSTEELF
jgi:5'-3' exonuclease